jgi:NADPH2:quinone reductase
VRSITDHLFRALRTGMLRPGAPATFPLAHAADAHRALEGRHTIGATILLP